MKAASLISYLPFVAIVAFFIKVMTDRWLIAEATLATLFVYAWAYVFAKNIYPWMLHSMNRFYLVFGLLFAPLIFYYVYICVSLELAVQKAVPAGFLLVVFPGFLVFFVLAIYRRRFKARSEG